MLTGNSLRYYKDAKAEETNTLDGRIDLSGCYDITEVNVGRNYGFRIKVCKTCTIWKLKSHWNFWEHDFFWLAVPDFFFIKECLEIPDTNQSQFKAYKYNPLIILVSSMCDKSLKAE